MEQDKINRVTKLTVELNELNRARISIEKASRLYVTAIGFLYDRTFKLIGGETIRDMMLLAIDQRIPAISRELEDL